MADARPPFPAQADHALISGEGTQNMTLTDIAAIVGMGTGIIGAWTGINGMVANWRTRRELHLGQKPVLKIMQGDAQGAPKGWTDVVISLRSRSSLGCTVEEITLLWPANARIGAYELKNGAVDSNDRYRQPEPRRRLALSLKVAHAGALGIMSVVGRSWPGTEEMHQSHVLLSVPGRSRARVIALFKVREETKAARFTMQSTVLMIAAA